MNKNDQNRAVIFDIQRFSLHDGPGIRTTLFFKGCPLRCRWCQNPESRRKAPEISFKLRSCIGCFDCFEKCTEKAIIRNGKIRIDYGRCSNCGQCIDVCPSKSLRLIGKEYSEKEIFDELLRDKDFFIDSGGGVTFSGGEPLLHSSFLESLSRKLKDEKIHCTIETCGFFRYNQIKPILPNIDLIYFDLKQMDTKLHKKHTGQGNQLILENFKKLSFEFDGVQPRMPVIPEVNDDEKSIRETAHFLKQTGHESIHCLPYHDMGKAKESLIDYPFESPDYKPATDEIMAKVKNYFQMEDIDAVIYS